MPGILRFVLGDQLTPGLASLVDLDPAADVVLMAEVAAETTYVPHHPKKIAFILSAMRHFAAELAQAGIEVAYRRLDDPDAAPDFRTALVDAVRRYRPDRVVVTEPGEYRVLLDMQGWAAAAGVPVEIRPDTRFLCSREAFAAWADGRRQYRMEYFYREMRRRTGLLMDKDGTPCGGTWNLDAENRRALPASQAAPPVFRVAPDAVTADVLALVAHRFAGHFGALEPFGFAVTRADAEAAFAHFLEHGLPRFGDYQDAMRGGDPVLFHAVVALYLNVGLLDPLALCRRVEAAWRAGAAPLNAAEGFIRQIIGWREYVRGIYWRHMPEYVERNALGATRPLPALYWTGETELACLAACVDQTRREAYAHHIQRLMVTGNFALLIGVAPAALHEWYLAVYADAFEWVELPNTLGMALHADGGLLGSKPYAASGKYIDRMSDYCDGCRFDVRRGAGPDACPFNYLYWNFLITNRARLGGNPRLAMPYRTLDRMGADTKRQITADAAAFLAGLA